jgi:hypothetical protein
MGEEAYTGAQATRGVPTGGEFKRRRNALRSTRARAIERKPKRGA